MGRSPCCDKNGLKKGPWTPEEDLKLIQYVEAHGASNWRTLPKNAGLQRCGKSCRLRWTNYLRPDIKRGRFSFEEEETIIQLHSVLGNKWSAIAARLPGRTDNEIKNYWNTHIRKRLLKMGIDPVTHSPRLDLYDLSSLLNSSSSSSPQLNLSSLLGLQTLMNPELLRVLVASLLTPSTNHEKPDILLPKFQENQMINPQMQSQATQNFQHAVPQVPIPPCSSFMDQNLAAQGYKMADLSMLLKEINNGQTFQDQNLVSPSIYGYGMSDNTTTTDNSENCSTFCSLNSGSMNQNLGLDHSVFSTPLSGSPLNSSNFINCGGTSTAAEDERESYCSDLMKFEIPESFDFDSFM